MTTLDAMASTKKRNPDGNVADDEDRQISEAIGRQIALLCELHGLSLRGLEQRAGLSNATLASLVSGRRAGGTTVRLLCRVAEALGIDFVISNRDRIRVSVRHEKPPKSGDASQLELPRVRTTAGSLTHAKRPLKSRRKKPPKR